MKNPLKTWRKVYGLSRERAAQALGLSYGQLSRLENDYHETLSGRVLDGLTRAGVNVLEFRALWAKYMLQRRREAVAVANGTRAEVRP